MKRLPPSARSSRWKSWLAGGLALMLPSLAGAQSVSVLEWSFGTSSYTSGATVKHSAVSTANPTLTASSVSGFALTQRGNTTNRYPELGSWTSSETSMTSGRSSYSPVSGAKVFYGTFTLDSLANGDWSDLTVRLDYQRVNSASPTRVRAYLTWQDGSTWRTAYSNLTTLSSSTRSWVTNLSLPFANGASLPTVLAGEQFLLELQFSTVSNSTNAIYVDNVKLLADSLTDTADFGDEPGFAAASQNASADIKIGTAATDAEAGNPTTGDANADDGAGTDDEDLTIGDLVAGVSNTLAVPVTITTGNLSGSTARLGVFVDWNGDGDVADANETMTAQTVGSSGTYNFTLFPPYGTTAGTKYLRLRITEGSTAPTFSGASMLKGEVEDYAVTVTGSESAPLGDYNVIAINSLSTTTDIQGRIITANFTGTASCTLAKNYSSVLSPATQSVQVQTNMVGGSPVNLQYGSLYLPSSGALNSRTINYNGGGSFQTSPAPDFAAVFNNVTAASAAYAGLAANSTATIPLSSPGAATLTVGTLNADGVAVFNVSGAQLLNNSYVQQMDLNLNGTTPSAIVINVTGTSVTYGASGNMVGNLTSSTWRNKVLWNFPQAASLAINKSFNGSILAPLATVSASGGALEGSVACYNLASTVEVKLTNFVGVVTPPASDFGDYPSFASASQTAHSAIRIGTAATDAEEVNPATGAAASDDSTATDDEDLTMPVLTAGTAGTLAIPVTLTAGSLSGSTARINVFADWNGDGDVADTNETQTAQTAGASGTYNFSLTAPSSTTAGTKYLRVRITEGSTAPTFSGASALKGEVEDYPITVNAAPSYDYGDSSAVGSAWSLINSSLKIGALVDTDVSTLANSAATGDDSNGSDDEDGVTFPAIVRAGMAETISVTLTNNSGAAAYLNAWMDFNLDGDFDDSGERVISNITVPNGTTNATSTHKILVADAAVVPNGIPTRFRLTSTSNPSSIGLAGSGEVEDYAVNVTRPACNLTGQTMPDFRTLTRQTSTNGIGWITAARPGTLSQTFLNWRGTGVNTTFNYSNNMWDANAPNVYTESAASTYEAHCSPLYWGALRFTNNTASTPAGAAGGSTGAARMEIVFSQPVWVDAFRVGGLSKVGAAWEWARVTAYSSDGAIVPPTSHAAGGVDCSGNPSPFVALVQDDGAGGSYAVAVDSESNGDFNDVTYSYSRVAVSRIVVDHWAGTSGSDPAAAHSSQQTAIAISGFCFTDATPRMGIGNLVFKDANLNGRYDSGEGVGGAQVRLYRQGDVPGTSRPAAINTTTSAGVYGFGGLAAGSYYVHVPASEFAAGEPLAGQMSMAGVSTGDDNTGEDGVDDGEPAVNGISSGTVAVSDNGEPTNTTEAGAFNTSDDSDDNNTDLTVDFDFVVPMDFGDLADTGTGTSAGNYRTLYSDSGPGHVANSRLKLGALLTAEVNGQPSADADSDDDDGITSMPSFTTGQTSTIPVKVTNTIGATSYLNGWLDLNNNGSFEDSGEKMSTVSVPNNTNNGTLNLSAVVSGSGVTGTPLGLRLRVSTISSLTSTGRTTAGEVEDYLVTLSSPTDYGDDSAFASAGSMVNANIRIGTNTTDSDTGTAANAGATSDDTTGTDDEDGVTFAALIPGQASTVSVRVTNSSGATAHLSGWIDFDNDGTLSAAEKVIADTVATGVSNVTRNYTVNVPAGAQVTSIGTRFRLCSVSGAAPTGVTGTGEVEDHAVTVSAPNRDSGDATGIAEAWSTANNNLRLGLTVDTEAAAVLNDTATGDDVTGNDDEDAVSAWPTLTAGTSAVVATRVRNASGSTAYLNVWVDWNGDGDMLDAGEQMTTNQSVSNGTDGNVNLNLAIPASAGADSYMLRMRLTNSQTPGPTGLVGTGEVEDYQITTICPAVTVTPASIANGTFGTAYSQALTATGAASPKTWSITGGALPGGVTLNSSSGLISGTPTAAGPFTFTVRAMDPYGCAGTASYTINISSLTIGNLVWDDVDNDGVKDAGEGGVPGAVVTLFSTGADNAIGGTGGNADTQVASTTTTGSGLYSFSALASGKYYVRVTPPASHPLTGGTVVTSDNRVDNDNNGSQPNDGGTDLYSPVIDLAGGAESTADGDSDANTELTVDFGLWSGFTVGNTIWHDANANGLRNGGEAGVSGALVELFTTGADNAIGGTDGAADLLVGATTTNSGAYSLRAFTPGRYYLRVTPPSLFPTVTVNTVSSDNGIDDDNNGSQPGGEFDFIYSPVFQLAAGTEPGGGGTGNADNTLDFGLQASVKGSVGNLVFLDANNNGRYDSGDSGISGVTVQLHDSATDTLVAQTTTGGVPSMPGWAIQQAASSTALSNLSLADACLAGTNRIRNYTGSSSVVNFFGNGSDFGMYGGGSLMPDSSGDNIAIKASGTITIPVTGAYTFGINTDAGGRLRIDGAAVITDAGPHVPTTVLATVTLSAGQHSIEFTGYETTGGEGFEVFAAPGTYASISSVDTGSFGAFRLVGDTSNGGLTVTYPGDASQVGRYRFNNVVPGSYYVKVPAADFASGAVLGGVRSFIQATPPTDDQRDDDSAIGSADSGVDDSLAQVNGLRSHVFAIALGAEPTDANGETGFLSTEDDAADSNADLTIDFAFHPTLTIGNLVWSDSDGDGVKDSGEPGVAGATVQLFATGTDNAIGGTGGAADTQVGANVVTGSTGEYRFSGLEGGKYYVKVTPPSSHPLASGGVGVLDNRVDNDNNGTQPGGVGTAFFSPVIDLAQGAESVTDGDTDSNTELTVDFALRAPTLDYGDHAGFTSASSTANSTLKIGTAATDVEAVATTNSTATGDDSTGTDDEDGVTISTLIRGLTASVTVKVTNTTGSTAYLNGWIDWNNNGVLTDSGEQILTNRAIANNTNGIDQAVSITVPAGAALGNIGTRFRLTSVQTPGSTGTSSGTGEVEDHLVAVVASMTLGNLIWNDGNDNGIKDAAESGVNNILVELWTPGSDNAIGGTGGAADTRVSSVTTSGGGLYSFTNLAPGSYFVKVPTPPFSKTSTTVSSSDNGVDNDNNGIQPGGSGTSAYSQVVTLTPGQEPGTGGGTNADNTIDMGFVSNIGSPFVCDNRFYIMQNAETSSGSGVWDSTIYYIADGPSLEPIFVFAGKKLNGLASYGGYLYCVDQGGNHLYRINSLGTLVDMGEIPGLPSPGSNGQWSGATALTNGRMILNLYTFSPNQTTLYTLDLATASLVGSGVVCTNSATGGVLSGNFGDIAWDPTTNRLYGYNTVDSSWLGLFELNATTGVCTRVASSGVSSFGSLVIDANGLAYGYGGLAGGSDQTTLYIFNRTGGALNGSMTAVGSGPEVSNSDGAACPGAPPSMKIGNLVWNDVNNNGTKDSGEAGLDGVALQLFYGGQDPTAVAPLATTTSAGGGAYAFNNLPPGQYFVYMPTPPAAYPLSSSTSDAADNNQDNDDNGSQTVVGGPVRSPMIALAAGTEPVNDGDTDANSDLTLDFGLVSNLTIGNLVWSDTNNNGAKDSTETGLSGLTVQLYSTTDSIAGNGDDVLYAGGTNQTTTSGTGTYSFTNLQPGKFVVRVTPPSGGITSGTPVTADNSVDNDNNGSQPGGTGTVLISPVITLTPGGEVTTDGDSSINSDMTVDFGIFTGITVGNLVWNDANNNGIKDTAETGVNAVTVELMSPGADNAIGGTGVNQDTVVATTTTNSSGAYNFLVYTPGRYFLRVTPTAGLPAASFVADTADNGEDNDNDGSQPAGQGSLIYSPVFQLSAGAEPGTGGSTNAENTLDFGLRACPAITISPTTAPNGIVGTPYSQLLTASGGNGAVTFSVSAGALPAGLTLSPSGSLGGTPTSATSATFTVRAVDAAGCIGTRSYTMLPVCPVITVTPATIADAMVGTAYSQPLSVSGGVAPYTWSVASGTLPAGLTLNAGNGLLSGTPTTANGAGASLTLRATDANGCAGSVSVSLQVCPVITLSQSTLPNGTAASAYSQSVTASGGVAPYVYGIASGSLPAGLTLNTSSGAITGTPTSTAAATFTLRATDASGCEVTRTYTITPACPVLSIAPGSLSVARVGSGFSQTLTASGGISPYSGWTVTSGTLPAGLTLNASTGVLSGTPTAANGAGTSITVRVSDANGCQGTATYSLKVCPVVSLSPTTLANGVLSLGYSQSVAASGGAAPYTYTVSAGTLPAGLTLNASTGAVAGTPTAVATSAFTLAATDANGCSGTRSFSVAVTNITLGNLVWNDVNSNGLKDASEPGVANVTVELMATGADNAIGGTGSNADTVSASTTTNSSGIYGFSSVPPGRYFVRITPPADLPLASTVITTADNGVDNDNNGAQTGGPGGVITSPVIQLAAGMEPGTNGTTSSEQTIDFGITVGNSVIWLIDEDYTLSTALHLWSFTNYRSPSTTATDYGRLKYRRPSDGAIRDIADAGDIESMGVNRFTGEAYILSSDNISGAPSETQSLWTYNLNDAPANIGNIVLTLIGHIKRPTNGAPMECLAYDPLSKRFYTADPKDDDQNSSTSTDRLYYLDIRNLNSNVMLTTNLTSVGDITGLSNTNRYVDGLEFSLDGKLYSVDGTDDDVYEISPATGAIIALTDTDIAGGAGGSVDVETMAWDEVSNRLIAVDNSGRRFIEVTRGSNGSNIAIASFVTGVPGMPSNADLEASAMYDTYPPRPKMTLGNAVFIDANYNGVMDSGEGVNGVKVELYEQGDTPGVTAAAATTTTANGGGYLFTNLLEGSYFVHIPASNFASGAVLFGHDSVPGVASGDDGSGEDGVDNSAPATNGISSATVTLADNAEPVNSGTENGYRNTDDDADDNNGDLTVDFGFRNVRMSIGSLVWSDTNNNGIKDASEPGLGGVTVQLYTSTDLVAGDADDALYTGGTNQVATSAGGAYSFSDLPPGMYVVRAACPAGSVTSGTPVASDNSVDNDNNGSQPGGVGTVLISPVITLAPNTESVTDGDTNTNSDMTVDFGVFTGITVGNLVWNDSDNDGVKDSGEAGVNGVTVELLTPGADNAIGGSGANADTVVGSTTTDSGGAYSFLVYNAGRHFLRITPTAGLPAASILADAADNGEDNDNNGVQPGGQGTAIFSPVVQLTPGTEPGSTGSTNAETTLDFGLRACPVIAITPSSLPAATVGSPYSQIISVSGGAAPYTWTVSAGALPAGLALNGGTGLFSGTPSSPASSSFTIRVVDSAGCVGTRSYIMQPVCPVISISPSTLPAGLAGTAYSQTLSVSGGASPYTWSVSSGTLPAGLTLNAGTGLLSGTPTVANGAGASITFRVQDATGCAATQVINVQMCPVVTLSPTSLTTPTVGTAYNQSVTASGGASPYAYTIASGALPAGLTLNASTGAITGTPGSAAAATFTVRATDASGCQGTRSYSLTPVCPALTVSPSTLAAGTVGSTYSQIASASGGTAPYTWAVSSGSLPAGLALNASTGSITGTPTSTATATFILRATDNFGCQATRGYSVTPACPAINVTTVSLNAYLSAAASLNLAATSGTAPYTWAVTGGALPAGLSLSSTGAITGTPSALGAGTFTVRVTDTYGCQATQSVTVTVKGMTLGSRVWQDNDNDGVLDAGEPGVSGAVVQLLNPGTDNAIGGTGGAADVQVGALFTTDSSGGYSFANLVPGSYYVKVVPPAAFTHTGGTPATADNNVDNNNDGAQPGGPGTPLFSPVIALQPGTESVADGDADSDTNLTVDFGVWASMGVGSMLFVDLNADGVHVVNEGVEFVFIQIFSQGANVATDEPATVTLTGKKGRFLLPNLNPGSYFVHVPASEFASGALLSGMVPVNVIVPGDDDVGQDLVFNNNPAVNGASTAVFTLTPGQAPVGSEESGFEGVADDDGIDSNTDLTRDLGFVSSSGTGFPLGLRESRVLTLADTTAPAAAAMPGLEDGEAIADTFVRWQQLHPLDGANGANDNPDGDLYPNLLEYALDTDAADGASGTGHFRMELNPALSTADILVTRPASGRVDIIFNVEASTDLHSWTRLSVTPQSGIGADGSQTLRYADVGSDRAFAGQTRGFVRLRIALDADLDGEAEASVTAPVQMFSREFFPVGTRSFAVPLVRQELFAGTVASVEGPRILLPAGLTLPDGPCYVQVLSGPLAGRCMDVDMAASDGGSGRLALGDAAHGVAAGTRVAVHPHWTLPAVLPADSFSSGASSTTADRVMAFDSLANVFRVTWASSSGWYQEGASPAAALTLPPQSAVLVQTRTAEVSVLVTGQAPVLAPQLPSAPGTRFVSLGSVLPRSPKTAQLTAAAGFPAATNAGAATRLRVWKGDAAPGSTAGGYDNYFLLQTTTGSHWIKETDATLKDLSDEPLLPAFHGFFLVQP